MKRVGILSIGEMGYHWARLLSGHGIEVLTYAKGRSEITQKRAANAGVRLVPSGKRISSFLWWFRRRQSASPRAWPGLSPSWERGTSSISMPTPSPP